MRERELHNCGSGESLGWFPPWRRHFRSGRTVSCDMFVLLCDSLVVYVVRCDIGVRHGVRSKNSVRSDVSCDCVRLVSTPNMLFLICCSSHQRASLRHNLRRTIDIWHIGGLRSASESYIERGLGAGVQSRRRSGVSAIGALRYQGRQCCNNIG